MCGIFGFVSFDKPVKHRELQKASEAISHRGPDDEGYLLFDIMSNEYAQYVGHDTLSSIQFPHISIANSFNSAFLHRRLSIIDLSKTGHQPMSYDQGNYWIVYNGEIYNYLEIKKELEGEGYLFKSHSDTEVILAAYMHWGNDCVCKFNGMWAFAIWDQKRRLVFLSRDRFGIKPLYYYYKDGNFVFCSEIKGMLSYFDRKFDLNRDAVDSFLSKGEYIVGEFESTFFKDVYQLLPGRNLVFTNNSLHFSQYWNLSTSISSKMGLADSVEEIRNLLIDSIALHLRSDVNVGACLSGGIDSSSIVSVLGAVFSKKTHTFSAIWPGERYDESAYIDIVNKKYKCIQNVFEPDLSDIINIIDKEIWHQELPLATGSLLAQWFVMERAKKKGIKVLLDGQGADEIAAGYPRFILSFIIEMILKLRFSSINDNKNLLRLYGYSFRSIKVILRTLIANCRKRKNSFINLTDHLKSDLEVTCLPALLHYEDRNSMAHSVESRVPFLDYRLVELLFSIPSKYKIKDSKMKYILRKAVKEFLPAEIYHRKDKIGFETPIERVLKSNELYKSYNYNEDAILHDYISDKNFPYSSEQQKKFKYYALARFLQTYFL